MDKYSDDFTIYGQLIASLGILKSEKAIEKLEKINNETCDIRVLEMITLVIK